MSWLTDLVAKKKAQDTVQDAFNRADKTLRALLKSRGIKCENLRLHTQLNGKTYQVELSHKSYLHSTRVTCTSEKRDFTPWGCGTEETTQVLEHLIATAK